MPLSQIQVVHLLPTNKSFFFLTPNPTQMLGLKKMAIIKEQLQFGCTNSGLG